MLVSLCAPDFPRRERAQPRGVAATDTSRNGATARVSSAPRLPTESRRRTSLLPLCRESGGTLSIRSGVERNNCLRSVCTCLGDGSGVKRRSRRWGSSVRGRVRVSRLPHCGVRMDVGREARVSCSWVSTSQPGVRACDDRRGEKARSTRWGRATSAEGFPPRRILTTSRGLSNIFLRRRQSREKAGENSFGGARELWKCDGIGDLFSLVQRSAKNQPKSNALVFYPRACLWFRAVPLSRAWRF